MAETRLRRRAQKPRAYLTVVALAAIVALSSLASLFAQARP
jgi:hypothetical protein